MKKSLVTLVSMFFLLSGLLLNAQTSYEKNFNFKQMKKDAKGSCFSPEEGLPENTNGYFTKKGKELGEISSDSIKNKRLTYTINKDTLIMYFDSLKILFGADYKKLKEPTPEDTLRYHLTPIDTYYLIELDGIFGPVVRDEE